MCAWTTAEPLSTHTLSIFFAEMRQACYAVAISNSYALLDKVVEFLEEGWQASSLASNVDTRFLRQVQ